MASGQTAIGDSLFIFNNSVQFTNAAFVGTKATMLMRLATLADGLIATVSLGNLGTVRITTLHGQYFIGFAT